MLALLQVDPSKGSGQVSNWTKITYSSFGFFFLNDPLSVPKFLTISQLGESDLINNTFLSRLCDSAIRSDCFIRPIITSDHRAHSLPPYITLHYPPHYLLSWPSKQDLNQKQGRQPLTVEFRRVHRYVHCVFRFCMPEYTWVYAYYVPIFRTTT